MKKIIIWAIMLIISFQYSFSQDIILLKNNKKIKSKILLVENNKVYYKYYYGNSKKVKSLDLKNVKQIYFETQKKLALKKKTKPDSSTTNPIKNTKANVEKEKNKIVSVNSNHKSKNKSKSKKKELFKTTSHYKKRFGLGTDIFIDYQNQRFAGLSLDYYFIKNLNAGIGYGIFQGNPAPYFTETLIQPLKKTDWSIIAGYQLIFLDKTAVTKLEIFPDKEYDKPAFYHIISLGFEYRNISGLSYKFWFGTSGIDLNSIIKHPDFLMGFRVAGHI